MLSFLIAICFLFYVAVSIKKMKKEFDEYMQKKEQESELFQDKYLPLLERIRRHEELQNSL